MKFKELVEHFTQGALWGLGLVLAAAGIMGLLFAAKLVIGLFIPEPYTSLISVIFFAVLTGGIVNIILEKR